MFSSFLFHFRWHYRCYIIWNPKELHLSSPTVCDGVRVAHLFSFVCLVSCVFNVSSFSGLSILDCHFDQYIQEIRPMDTTPTTWQFGLVLDTGVSNNHHTKWPKSYVIILDILVYVGIWVILCDDCYKFLRYWMETISFYVVGVVSIGRISWMYWSKWQYVLSSVLWCPLLFPYKNDIRFVLTPSCLLMPYLWCVCIMVSNTSWLDEQKRED
jgi:hypothetical protein